MTVSPIRTPYDRPELRARDMMARHRQPEFEQPQRAVPRPIAEDNRDARKPFDDGQAGLRAFGLDASIAVAGLFSRVPDPVPAGAADPSAPGVVSGGTGYKVGPYEKPQIHHDNGFLQNPDDPTDPDPMPTREPTQEEVDYYYDQVLQAELADTFNDVPFLDRLDSRLGLDNALPAYEHFLKGNGADREFDYGAYLRDDPAGQATVDSTLSGVRGGADQLYGDLDQQVGDQPGDSITFEMQGDVRTTGDGLPGDPGYPQTEDWQKTIGGHSYWSQSTVTVTRQEDGSLLAVADVTMHAEDRYNFNPGQSDIATGAADSERGVLEESGLAQQYTQTGSTEYTTSWTIGQPGSPSAAEPGHSGR